jgi:hypothetical protein
MALLVHIGLSASTELLESTDFRPDEHGSGGSNPESPKNSNPEDGASSGISAY